MEHDRSHSDKVQQAIDDYNRKHPEQRDIKPHQPSEEKKGNFLVQGWEKIGKTGQVIALVAGILTGLTTIYPYAERAYDFMADFVNAVEVTRSNTDRVAQLEKANEINTSIQKSQLHPYHHTNPDGTKVKLYQTNPVHGKKMTYHFVEASSIFYVANENLESGYWYYIDAQGTYYEIQGE